MTAFYGSGGATGELMLTQLTVVRGSAAQVAASLGVEAPWSRGNEAPAAGVRSMWPLLLALVVALFAALFVPRV